MTITGPMAAILCILAWVLFCAVLAAVGFVCMGRSGEWENSESDCDE